MAKKINKDFVLEMIDKKLNGVEFKLDTEKDCKIYTKDLQNIKELIEKM